jgi:vacuolar-type H+-ATPase subunit I/STV1
VLEKGPHYKEYSAVSHYKERITYFENEFSREKMKIIINRDLKQKPKKVMKKVYKFIDVDKNYEPSKINKRFNKMEIPKVPSVVRLKRKISSNRELVQMIPKRIRSAVRRLLKKLNYKRFEYPKMDESMRKVLLEKFISDVEFVENRTEKTVDHWKK